MIAAQIDSDEPSPVPAYDDLANFASHRDFLLARKKRHTSRTRQDRESRYSTVVLKKRWLIGRKS